MTNKQRFKILLATVAFIPALATAESKNGDTHAHHHHEHQGELTLPADLPSSNSLFLLDSNWNDQQGKELKLSEFKGRPIVLSMFYSSCTVACPIIAENVKKIERQVKEAKLDVKPQYVLVTFDPAHDSSEVLREYAKSHGMESTQWSLLSGAEEDTRELAVLLGIRYKKNSDGGFSHSNMITLLDSAGDVVHRHEGLRFEPQDVASFVSKLQEIR